MMGVSIGFPARSSPPVPKSSSALFAGPSRRGNASRPAAIAAVAIDARRAGGGAGVVVEPGEDRFCAVSAPQAAVTCRAHVPASAACVIFSAGTQLPSLVCRTFRAGAPRMRRGHGSGWKPRPAGGASWDGFGVGGGRGRVRGEWGGMHVNSLTWMALLRSGHGHRG